MKSSKDNQTITSAGHSLLFDSVCLPPHKQIPLHSQSSWELSCIITGEGTRLIADVSEPFVAGETILIPPGVPHCWYFNKDKTDDGGNIENITIFFSTDTITNLSRCCPELSDAISHIESLSEAIILAGETRKSIFDVMLRMRRETAERRILSFMEILLILAEDKTSRIIMGAKQMTRSEIRLSQIRSYINCNYSDYISIEEISAHLGMNRSSFCSFFKRETGETFTEYLNNQRLSTACEMLVATERQVGEIAAAVGFPDMPYFCRLFKKKFEITPTEYRVRYKYPEN